MGEKHRPPRGKGHSDREGQKIGSRSLYDQLGVGQEKRCDTVKESRRRTEGDKAVGIRRSSKEARETAPIEGEIDEHDEQGEERVGSNYGARCQSGGKI